jgi:TonB family protein
MTAITRALSAALLHFVWQGLGVTIVLWLALFLLRRRSAALRYAASCAALALLAALPAVTTAILYEHPAPAVPLAVHPSAAADLGPFVRVDAGFGWMSLLQAWAIPVWSCGVLLFSIRMLWGCTRIAALRRRGETADARILSMISSLASRMGVARPVRVLLSTVADSPSVTGWLRPVILLPLSAIAGLTPDQLEAVLAHELAHIRRHDYAVNLLQMAVETVLFYHPAVWWISGRIRLERELCCDDLTVQTCGGAVCYARALTALEKMRAGHAAPALAATDGPLFLRIRRLVAGGGEYGPSKLSGMIAISLGVACLTLCVHWVRAQEPVRGVAIMKPSSAQDGELGVTVDTAGAAVIHRTSIAYPRALIGKHVEGTVAVEATLDTTGSVIDAHVLSGPDELRKAALSSVLNWHFAPGSGNTRIVKIAFQEPAATPAVEPEQKSGSRGTVSVRTRTAGGEAGTVQLNVVGASVESAQTQQTSRFLEEQLEKSRQQLERTQSQPDADPERVAKARQEVSELESKLAGEQSVRELNEKRERVLQEQMSGEPASPERAMAMEQLLRQAREREQASRGWVRVRATVGSKLAAVEIRGLSDQAGSDLLSRLPVHEGDTLTQESIEAAGRAIRQFDEHLEFSYAREPEGAILRIHPAGAADAPLLQRK